MGCIMVTSRFGVTVAFLHQMHERMLREHVSFVGEADVARRFAKRMGHEAILPKRLRLYLSSAWYIWRLALRCETLSIDTVGVLDMCAQIDSTIEDLWPKLAEHFEVETASRARASAMKTDVQVVDGNAKNRRLVCAASSNHVVTCPFLKRSVCVTCPHTPLLGSPFCAAHASTSDCMEVDYEIIAHEDRAGEVPEGKSWQTLVRQKDGGTDIWIDQDLVHPSLVADYFKREGHARLAVAAQRRKKQLLARQAIARQHIGEMSSLEIFLGPLHSG